jgi:hypothetical protein
MSQDNSDLPAAASPAASGPAGPRFEGKVGAFYFLALLGRGEPRGLPGAVARTVRFQQSAHNRPLDDVTIDATNADGSEAFLDIQAKRTINFTQADPEFADVVRRLWATAQQPQFATARYELAVAIARTSTRIERDCQQVLQWARQLTSGGSFAAHMQRRGFASNGMRAFVDAFRQHLVNAGAPTDDETVWRFLQRFQVLVFDFEGPGSDYDHRARERARSVLAPDQAARAANLWSILTDYALACDAAGGEVDRPALIRNLEQEHGFRFADRSDLRVVHARLSEAADHALADIKDNIGGAQLSRAELIEEAYQALEQSPVVQIVGAAGVGKSAVLKALALRQRNEGTVLMLAPGRIISGGWLQMAQVIRCPVGRNELFNELGCSGGATLFVDNIDQIDDAEAWLTLRDLLRGAVECPGWRAVFTVRSDNQEWHANLPDELRELPFGTVRVSPLSDPEADVLRAGNPALSALLSGHHPARVMARNLFYLSRMVDLAPSDGQLANETDLAKIWWRFGGGRSETGKFERLRLLRGLGEQLIRRPGLVSFAADELESSAVEELLRVESLREERPGATVAFWHDTLRDWTVGFLLDERSELREVLPTDRPMPGALARGLEMAARVALASDTTGDRWLGLLAAFEQDGCHGSWRRPILMALPRSENALELFERVEAALVADRGRRLKEIMQLMIAVETVPLAQILVRAQTPAPISEATSTRMMMPTGPTWMPLVAWVLLSFERLPSALIPDVAKVFQLWLVVTQSQTVEINQLIVQRFYEWLTRIEEAKWPVEITDIREARRIDLDFGHLNEVHENIRMTFLSFCHLNPEFARRYLAETDPERHYDARDILRYSGAAAKAAPAALADFALAVLIPEDDEDNSYRRGHDRFGPFGVFDSDFMPASPGQGPFFALLQESREEGLRLVRGIVEHATQWYRERYAAEGAPFPSMIIPFPESAKSFEGDFTIYQWARGGTGPQVAASALMALEAWAHRQIEGGRPPEEALHDVLGTSGSSIAFLCVATDLVLSHWPATKEVAWPLLAVPELLQYDHMRFSQDRTGMGRFFVPERELEHWPVKSTDLLARPSRQLELIDKIGDYAVYGPADLHAKLRDGLRRARDRVAQGTHQDDSDRFQGRRVTAERALRMSDAAHWKPATFRLADGREIEGRQYQLPPEEIELRSAAIAESNANIAELNMRAGLQKALTQPETSTQDITARGIVWARAHRANGEREQAETADISDMQWQARAVIMSAALAARDYEGVDRADVEAWCRPILDAAATEKNDDISSRTGDHIYSNKAAIAAVGCAGLFRRNRDSDARNTLLVLAARQDHPVLHAIGGELHEFGRLDARFARALTRLIMLSSAHPRRTFQEAEDAANFEGHRRNIADAIEAERRWLAGINEEPAWPALAPWHSRRRRSFRIGRHIVEEDSQMPRVPIPEMYVDEYALGILAGHLVPLALDEVPEWLISLADHFRGWTIEANNGPPGDDEGGRDNRPYAWNIGYFDFLGILCATLPFEQARSLFIEPIMVLHEDALHEAMAAFLRGFDRATLAIDTPEPENPVGVRSLFVEQLRGSRAMRHLNDRASFSAETHLGDALHALFYQPSRWLQAARAYVPDRWEGLLESMPLLTSVVTLAPKSGYVAGLFLTLMESSPRAALLPYMVDAVTAWCKAYGVGTRFWNEYQVGHRICEWIEGALNDNSDLATVLPRVRDDLGKCLDVLIRSGVAPARALEARIADDASVRKTA